MKRRLRRRIGEERCTHRIKSIKCPLQMLEIIVVSFAMLECLAASAFKRAANEKQSYTKAKQLAFQLSSLKFRPPGPQSGSQHPRAALRVFIAITITLRRSRLTIVDAKYLQCHFLSTPLGDLWPIRCRSRRDGC